MTFTPYTQAGTSTHTLSGAVNGTNTLFGLLANPGALQVFRNGLLQMDRTQAFNAGWDISWTGTTVYVGGTGTDTATITFTGPSTPQTGDIITAWVYSN